VWVSTDWHAVKFDKQTHAIGKRDEYDAIRKACSVINPDDVWLYLGDLIDSEVQKKAYLDELLSCIKTDNRILLLGNNDRWDDYSKWFTFVENTILMPDKRVVITHCPIPNKERINIHGHIHVHEPGYGTAGAYWRMYDIEPGNHVNAFTYPHTPILLDAIIKRKPSCFVQKIPGMRGKPYTQDLVNNEIRDYQVLGEHYDREGYGNEDENKD
jgi:calcineurin-like phosphoesterase family protein